MNEKKQVRAEKARLSLEGLSVGDAFGEQFFFRSKKLIEERRLPPGSWAWTDDTHMALSIVEVLLEQGQIEQEPLAQAFSRRFREQPGRGTGSRVSAQDTVPYCMWCAAHHMRDYAQALWTTVSGMGDRDTTCAIVGGIVALSAGQVPEDWRKHREPLPREFLKIDRDPGG